MRFPRVSSLGAWGVLIASPCLYLAGHRVLAVAILAIWTLVTNPGRRERASPKVDFLCPTCGYASTGHPTEASAQERAAAHYREHLTGETTEG
jgi:hypothetical protein